MKSFANVKLLSSLIVVSGVLFAFQNCGGGDSSGQASVLEDSPDNKKFKAAPYPFDANFNQLAYMTCPMASESKSLQEDLDNPFFTIRAGAYDNRSLATRFPQIFTGTFQEPERTYRLKAGVGLRKEYVDYIKTNFSARLALKNTPDTLKTLLRNGVMNGEHKWQPLMGLVFRLRSNQGFAWETDDAKLALAPLFDNNTANQIVAGMDMGPYGYERVNYLTGTGDLAQRSYVASIGSFAKDESQRDFLRSQMGTNVQIVAGFANDGAEGTVLDLQSPTDSNKTLYGRVYRLSTTRQWPGRVDCNPCDATNRQDFQATSVYEDFISGVQELDTSTANEKDLTLGENQRWECFSLMVVRDIDRRDPVTNKYFDPDYDPALWTGTKKNKYYDFQANPRAPIVPGVRVACPPQEIGDGTRRGTLNYVADGGYARLRLEIARRFLPADLWDINTNPEYMCAVPRAAAQGFGQCYAAGDFNAAQYVMYTQQGTELGKAIQCGRNPVTGELQKECPAFVNICYRKQ